MLTIRGLKKAYGTVLALDGVDLDVGRGEIVGLLGPNGAGKTTLVSIVAGLRRADAGTVRIGDIDAFASQREAKAQIGLAPQDLGVYPIVSVRQNLRLFGEIAGLKDPQLNARIDDVAAALRFEHLLDRLAGTLSGGERRRVHTAIALLHQPPLLLLDEPTAGADVRTRGDILRVVKELAAEGSAVVYSTHYMPEVEQLEASVAILEQGRMIARGALRELIAQHGSSAVELTFEGSPPSLPFAGVVSNGSLVRIPTTEPTPMVASAITALGVDAGRLRAIEIIRPSLESVYLSLTGHRYTGDGDEGGNENGDEDDINDDLEGVGEHVMAR